MPKRIFFLLTLLFAFTLGLESCGGGSAVNNSTSTSLASCAVAGKNVFVPNNASCLYNSITATCTNGALDYMSISSATGIIVTNGVTLSCL